MDFAASGGRECVPLDLLMWTVGVQSVFRHSVALDMVASFPFALRRPILSGFGQW